LKSGPKGGILFSASRRKGSLPDQPLGLMANAKMLERIGIAPEGERVQP